jgi:hypothetical protein
MTRLIHLTRPEGHKIIVAADSVSIVSPDLTRYMGGNTIVRVDGENHGVKESVEEIGRLLDETAGAEPRGATSDLMPDDCNFEGPAYADRVNGKLTFRDWRNWHLDDLEKYRDDPRLKYEQALK